MTKNIGKPCAGKPHARFDEGREVQTLLPTLPIEPVVTRPAQLITHQFR